MPARVLWRAMRRASRPSHDAARTAQCGHKSCMGGGVGLAACPSHSARYGRINVIRPMDCTNRRWVLCMNKAGRDAARLAGALTVASQRQRLKRIDAVAFVPGKVFAVQNPQSEWSKRADVDPDQARRTPLSESSIASTTLANDQIQVRSEQPSITHEHNHS